jgi:hypothetical protein
MSIYVGQCGVEKSGNYLLFRIIKSLLPDIDSYQSYSNITGCWDSLMKMNDTDLSFPELESMDEFRIDDDQTLYHLNSHFKASFSIWDMKSYESKTALLWTHQPPNKSHFTVLKEPRYWFYIIRDGRDVVNSWLHYAVSPRMLKRHPQYKINNVEELYSNMQYFKDCANRWCDHVTQYLRFKDKYTLILFENLIDNKFDTIARIADKLGVKNVQLFNNAYERTQIEETKKEAPLHVRKGKKSDWTNHFTFKHKDIFKKIAGNTLIEFGYEESNNW